MGQFGTHVGTQSKVPVEIEGPKSAPRAAQERPQERPNSGPNNRPNSGPKSAQEAQERPKSGPRAAQEAQERPVVILAQGFVHRAYSADQHTRSRCQIAIAMSEFPDWDSYASVRARTRLVWGKDAITPELYMAGVEKALREGEIYRLQKEKKEKEKEEEEVLQKKQNKRIDMNMDDLFEWKKRRKESDKVVDEEKESDKKVVDEEAEALINIVKESDKKVG